MAETKYKYNLRDRMKHLKPQFVVKELEKEGIPERTFYRDCDIKLNSTSDIASKRLMIYAKFFGVSIEELFNYNSNIKSISERKLTAYDKVLIKKTGLKR